MRLIVSRSALASFSFSLTRLRNWALMLASTTANTLCLSPFDNSTFHRLPDLLIFLMFVLLSTVRFAEESIIFSKVFMDIRGLKCDFARLKTESEYSLALIERLKNSAHNPETIFA